MSALVLVKATEDSEKGYSPTPETAAMGRFNDHLVKAGIMKEGNCDGLKPSSVGKRVAFDGAGRTVIEGPSPTRASWSPTSGGGGRLRIWTRPLVR